MKVAVVVSLVPSLALGQSFEPITSEVWTNGINGSTSDTWVIKWPSNVTGTVSLNITSTGSYTNWVTHTTSTVSNVTMTGNWASNWRPAGNWGTMTTNGSVGETTLALQFDSNNTPTVGVTRTITSYLTPPPATPTELKLDAILDELETAHLAESGQWDVENVSWERTMFLEHVTAYVCCLIFGFCLWRLIILAKNQSRIW